VEIYILIACMIITAVTPDAFLQSVKLWQPDGHLTNTYGTKIRMRGDHFEYSKFVALMLRFFIGKVGAKIFAKHPLALFNNNRPKK